MHWNDVDADRFAALEYTWGAGVVGGVVGGLGMGVLLHAGANIMPFVGALYGWPTVVGGWVAHLVNSVLIGLLFVALVSRPVVREQMTTVPGSVAAGVLYSAGVGLATSGIMLPIAMNVLGTETLPQPLVPVPGIVGGTLVVISVAVAHIVYGALLGAMYCVVHRRAGGRSRPAG